MTKKVVELTDQNFDESVLKSDVPVLVDFHAPWCGPCVAMSPSLEQLATEFEGKFKIVKLNVDENYEKSTEYKIKSLPTLMVFKDGMMEEKLIGGRGKEELKRLIETYIHVHTEKNATETTQEQI